MPTVSVILPTYNRARTLGRAIRSVLAQTFADLELIVVDDASTDDTRILVQSIADPRLRYYRLERNLGAAGARNAGLVEAAGDWLAFQDSDDEWLIAKLELQLQAARDAGPDAGLVIGAYVADFGNRTMLIRAQSALSGHGASPDLLDGWPIITPTWLVRRQLVQNLGAFDRRYACLEDWDLVLRMSEHCRVVAVEQPVLVKHGSPDSICSDPRKLSDALESILKRHRHRWRGEPRRHARRLAHLGCLQYQLGQRAVARRTLWQAWAETPHLPQTNLLLAASWLGPRALRIARRWCGPFATMAP